MGWSEQEFMALPDDEKFTWFAYFDIREEEREWQEKTQARKDRMAGRGGGKGKGLRVPRIPPRRRQR
jgi:hypothetical protein